MPLLVGELRLLEYMTVLGGLGVWRTVAEERALAEDDAEAGSLEGLTEEDVL